MKFPFVSPKLMKQIEAVVVLAAGPSLERTKPQVIEWQKKYNAAVIGAHYGYFLDPEYTVFTTPFKFRKAQGKLPGIYILGPRIKKADVFPKLYKRVMRHHYTKTNFTNWKSDVFFDKSYRIPQGGCGFEAMIMASFCRPSHMLFAGFDGFELKKNSLVVKHATKVMSKAKAGKSVNRVSSKKKDRYMELEIQRVESLYKLFTFFISSGITLHLFEKDRFRNIDKNRLRSMGVNIIR